MIFEPFCGAGGMGTGFSRFFPISLAVDVKRAAVRTYSANHPGVRVLQADVRDLSGCLRDFEGIIGVIGGPPCQPWSRLNLRRKARDPREELMGEFMRLVGEIRPRFWVLENVPTVPGDRRESVLLQGRRLGYRVHSVRLDAADYGAAQHRRRWIAVGTTRRAWAPPRTRAPRTVREAFATLRRNWGMMRSSPEILSRLSRTIPHRWISLTGGFKNAIRLVWDEPSPTVVNLKKVYMVHPSEDRNISLAEAAALQGFPPEYLWCGTESEVAQLIADAMPVELAEAIAETLVEEVRG